MTDSGSTSVWPATLLALLLVLGPTASEAALSQRDLFSGGDGLLTHDDATAFDWLDVDQTLGLSLNAVVGGAGGWFALGFRHATAGELCGLADTVFATSFTCPDLFASPSDGGAGGALARALFGVTSTTRVEGLFQSSFPNTAGLAFFEDASIVAIPVSQVFVRNSDRSASTADPAIGHWLVRTPEPSVLSLLVLSTLALGLRRRPGGADARTLR